MGSFIQVFRMILSQLVLLAVVPLLSCSMEQDTLVKSFPPRLLYHATSCTPEEKAITIQKCSPRSKEDCEEVSVPTQRLDYILSCHNLTVTHCTEDLTAVSLAQGEEPQAPLLPLVGHTCLETQQEHCLQSPTVTNVTTTVLRCLVRSLVECEDVEYSLPNVVCHDKELNFIAGPE